MLEYKIKINKENGKLEGGWNCKKCFWIIFSK